MKHTLPVATALFGAVLAALSQPAQAYTLDFGNSAAQSFLGCADVGNVCSTYDRLLPSYGDVAGVVDVSTHSSDGGTLRWWNNNYNELYGVAFNNVSSMASPVWVDLVPQAAGSAVNLLHFDLAGYLGQRHNVAVSVIDLGSGSTLFSYLGDIGTPLVGGGAGGWGQHSGFDLALSSFSGLRIQWADPAVSANTAIDNIEFNIGAPVPEPATTALWAAGLLGLGGLLRRRRVAAGAGVALALLGAGAAQAAAPAAYSLQVLPAMPGSTLIPWVEGMNGLGQVVGRSDVGSDVIGTLWAPGTPARDLGGLPANIRWTMAYDINSAGTVVGNAAAGSTESHAFRWTAAGGMQDLSIAAQAHNSSAYGINNSGQIVGWAAAPVGMVAALWQADGSFTSLAHLTRNEGTALMSSAYAISDNGWVVGHSYFDSGDAQAFRWSLGGGMTALAKFNNTSDDYAKDVNNAGWAAGEAWYGNSSDDVHAVMWNPQGELIDIHGSDWLFSAAAGINGSGTIVGRGWRSADGAGAFVWSPETGMQNLDSLVVNGGTFRVREATAINEAGQIAGWGYDSVTNQPYAYVLTPTAPVPEPASWALLAAGVAGLAWRRRAVR